MIRLTLSTLLFCFLFWQTVAAERPACFNVKEYKLSNGLTVWLNEDHDQPKIFGAVIVKAGAKDCPDTGIAHYFEHMMFKGTDRLGTVDYPSEKILLDSIALKYDELATIQIDSLRLKIQKEINNLSIKAANYAIPNEFDRVISRYGGNHLNASTGFDQTMFFNVFSPQYINQWAEINSERIISPVFRLFQSELETVYEEKNMYDDQLGAKAVEKVLERFFEPHPYSKPILGSAENLKNPKLSEMQTFFEDYYVAGNMGLILCGDFHADEVLPILEKTFSRIRPGEAPKRNIPQPKPLNGKESFDALFNLPMIKIQAYCWRGTPANHPDEIGLRIASGLLNNENGTGYLDKLSVDGKILMAQSFNVSFNDAGLSAVAILPKIIGQSCKKAKKLAFDQIERIKKGDFTEEAFLDLKLGERRKHERELESMNSRAETMLRLFSQGKKWEEYLKEIDAIDALTKKDIIQIANKYYTGDYLEVTKKTGNYPKNKLKKPDFDPIIPKNGEAKSAYAKSLEELPTLQAQPRFLDFEKDVQTIQLTPNTALYVTENPVNDVFTLKLDFGKGEMDSKLVEPLTAYINYLGTDSLAFEQFRNKLQALGSTMNFSSAKESFIMELCGFDRHFESTMTLASDFLKHVKADPKIMKQVVDAVKVRNKSIKGSNDELANALMEKICYGEKSSYLDRLTLQETKKLKGPELLNELQNILKVSCNIHYCGTLSAEKVSAVIRQNLDVEAMTVSTEKPRYQNLNPVNEPVIYFMDSPKSSQSIVCGILQGGASPDSQSRYQGILFNHYFGGSMSSLVFQQIREFRSLAYRARANYNLPAFKHKDKPGTLKPYLSTQCDKTLDAITVMDSLIRFMPVKETRVSTAKEDATNSACNNYPNFRDRSDKIATLKSEGNPSDPNKSLMEGLAEMGLADIVNFYRSNISGKPMAWVVVGSKAKIDLAKLASFGKIIYVKPEEVYK
jgi:predicted Zn-dependent peptidase